jgi:hypothetical protein
LQLNIDLAGGGMPYTGNNLAIIEMLAPVNDTAALCMPDYSLVIGNMGENGYDFTQDPVILSVELINPVGEKDTTFININTGTLGSGELDTIKLLSSLLINHSGTYNFRSWLTSSIDNRPYDDTLTYEFISGKISLPVNEDFSADEIPHQFVSLAISGTDVWAPYTDTTFQILPPDGNGMLRYTGSRGSIARLTTRQLDLYGSVDPKVEFWYYHDTTVSELDNSYTVIKVLADDVPTTIQTLYRRGTTHGWELYTVDLTPFADAQCVLVQFESMNKYDSTSAQYIGYITITSMPNLEVSEIIISPEISVCHLTHKKIDVVLNTVVNQGIDFTRFPTSLAVEIPGISITPIPLESIMAGNSTDTITVADDMDLTDVSSIKVYLTSPVDIYPDNDTATRIINIMPDLSVTLNSLTGGLSETNCFRIGDTIHQELTITNTGNVDLTDIVLSLRITGDSISEEIKEEGSIDLQADSSRSYTFINTYTVPREVTYQVQVTAYLRCDSAKVRADSIAYECVDLHNLLIESIENPSSDSIGIRGSTDSITVSLRNIDDHNPFGNVNIIASIENEEGGVIFSRLGIIPNIAPLGVVSFTFPEKYNIPDVSIYYIRIYLNKVDAYPEDDTLSIPLQTRKEKDDEDNIVTGITSIFTLAQNIPNPANNSTRIDYSVPEAGQVIFHVHSISGQLLYSKTIEASSGTNSIELNTSTFAAGVYVYSMEYKGQRLIRQLIISN